MKKLQTILTILLAVILLTGCAVSAAMLPTEAPVAERTPDRLTPEEAASIALEDAGLTDEQAVRLRTEYEVDDGFPEYEVEFRSGDYEYDYTIHAESGAVRFRDKEYDPPKAAAKPTATEPAATAPAAAEEKITSERAAAIALEKAGLSRDAVTGLKVEYEVDDGVPEYEVEFRSGKLEYTVEIHAKTGAVLDMECDD